MQIFIVAVNFDDTKLKISGTTSAINAGKYTVTFTPLDLYMWSDSLDQTPKEVTWEIGVMKLTKPTATNTAFTYDQSAHAPTISNFSSTYMSQTGVASATNKGAYTISYSLKNASNTQWNDGTTGEVTINWTIAVNKLAKPTASKTDYDFTGSTTTLSVANFNDKYMSQTGVVSASAVGNYTAKYVLKDKTNTQWADGKTDDVTIPWQITKKELSAELSSGFAQNGTLTYNGGAQTVSIKNYNADYHVLGGTTSATNAGEYEATISPAGSYTWSDGSTAAKKIKWTIGAKKLTKPSATTTNFDYDGKSHTLDVSNYDSTTMSQTGVVTATNADSYSVTYSLRNTTNYNWADGTTAAKVIEWRISKRALSEANSKGFVQEGALYYSGETQSVTIKNASSTFHVITGKTSGIEAGTYTAYIQPISTYTWADGTEDAITVTWSIAPKKLARPAAAVKNIDYDSTNKTLGVTGYDSATMLQSGTVVASAVGSYTVKYNLKDTKNYNWSDGTTGEVTINWTIAKRVLTEAQSTGFAQEGTLTFNGTEQTVSIKNFSNTYHQLGGKTKSSDAGTFTATVSPAITHTWYNGTSTAINVNWTIAPKSVTRPSASTLSFTFDGNSKNLKVDNYDSAYMTQSGTTSESAVGEYSVTYSLKSKTNYVWDDGTTDDVEIVWTIGSKILNKPDADTKSFVYSGAEKTLSVKNLDGDYIEKVSGQTSAVNAGSYSVTYKLKDATKSKWSDGTTGNVTINWTITRKNLTAQQSDIRQSGTLTFDSTVKTVELTNYNSDYHSLSSTTSATAAGEYTVKVTPTANYAWNDGTFAAKNVKWTIGVRKLTKPSTSNSEVTYTGSTITLAVANFDDKYMTVSGNSSTNAGDYAATFALKNKASTAWADNSTDNHVINWKIKRKALAASNTNLSVAGTYTFNNANQTVSISGYDKNVHDLGGTSTASDAGSYTATVTPKANYAWSDGGYESKELTWVINQLIVDAPVAAQTEFAYDKKEHELSISGFLATYMTRTGDYKATANGNYAVVFTLIDPANVRWNVGGGETYTIEWSIGMTKVAVPEMTNGTFTYDGNSKAPNFNIEDSSKVSISGTTSAINAGEYIYTISLADSTTTVWSDGGSSAKNYRWKINRQKLDATQSDLRQSIALPYNGSPYAFAGYISNYDSRVHKLGNSLTGTDAGEYVVDVTPLDNYAWSDGSYGIKPVVIKIDSIEIARPTAKKSLVIRYDGEYHSIDELDIANYVDKYMTQGGDTGGKLASEGYVTYYDLRNKHNTQWVGGGTEQVKIEWSIRKDRYTKPAAIKFEFMYDGTWKKLELDDNFKDSVMTIDYGEQMFAGNHKACVNLREPNFSEWDDGSGNFSVWIDWTIKKATLPVEYNSVFVEPKTFDGYTQNFGALKYIDANGEVKEIENWGLFASVTNQRTAKDVGTYTITMTPDSNHCWSDGTSTPRDIEWEIVAHRVTNDPSLDPDGTNLLYNGYSRGPTLVNYEPAQMELSSETAKTEVGEYTIVISPKTGYAWTDGTTEPLKFKWSIYKNVYAKPVGASFTYKPEGYSFTAANYQSAVMEISSDSVTAATDVGEYGATYSLKDPVSSCWQDGTNTPVTVTWRIIPKSVGEYDVIKAYSPFSYKYGNVYDMAETMVLQNGVTVYKYLYRSKAREYLSPDIFKVNHTYGANDTGEYSTWIGFANSNYCWADGTQAEKKFTFRIEDLLLPTPEVDSSVSLVYDGDIHYIPLTNYDADTMYVYTIRSLQDNFTISGDRISAKSAGEYTTIVTPTKCKRWADGTGTASKEIKWRIERQPMTERQAHIERENNPTYWPNTTRNSPIKFYANPDDATDNSLGTFAATGRVAGRFVVSGNVKEGEIGEYTLTVEPNGDYSWTDGSIVAKEFKWYVTKTPLAVPYFSGDSKFEYNAKVHTVSVNRNKDHTEIKSYSTETTQSEANKFTAKDVGEYVVSIGLTAPERYAWAGSYSAENPLGYSGEYELWWSIGSDKLVITKPTLISGNEFEYGGDLKAPTINGYASETMVITGTSSATNVGSYYIIYSLKDKTKSIWQGGGTGNIRFDWEIKPKGLSEAKSTFTPKALTYNGSTQYLNVSACGEIKSTGTCANSEHVWSGTISASDAGTYTAYVSPAANRCWADGTTAQKTISWTISPLYVAKPTASKTDLTYGEKISISGYNASYMTASGTSTDTTAVGSNYKTTYTLKNTTNTKWSDNTTAAVNIGWSISAASLAKPVLVGSLEVPYDGAEHSVSDSGFDSATMNRSGYMSGTDAGSYSVVYTLKNTTNTKWADGATGAVTLTWTIKPKAMTAKQSNVHVFIGNTYTGAERSPTLSYFDASVHETSSETAAINAGEYTIVISPKKNYCWADGTTTPKREKWIMAKRSINIPYFKNAAQSSFVYDGKAKSPAIEWYGDKQTHATVTQPTDVTNVGTKTITYKLNDPANNYWYTFPGSLEGDTYELKWYITPKNLDKPTAVKSTFTYNGAKKTLELDGYDDTTMKFDTTSVTEATAAGEYKGKVALKDKTNYCWTSETEGDKADVEIDWKIDKYMLNNNFYLRGANANGAMIAPVDSYTYNGAEQAAYITTYFSNGVGVVSTMRWLIINGEIADDLKPFYTVVSGTFKATNAGTYSYVVKPNASCVWSGTQGKGQEERTFTWTIAKDQPVITLSTNTVNMSETTTSTGATLANAVVNFTTTSNAAVTVTSANPNIATVSKGAGKITISGWQNGTTTLTVRQAENSNYYAAQDKVITVNVDRTISSLSVTNLVNAVKNGSLLNYGNIGDEVYINGIKGTVGTISLNGNYRAVLIGYNHNPDLEGDNRAHFVVMRKENFAGNIAFTDSYYGTIPSSNETAGIFRHIRINSTTLAWAKSTLRDVCEEFYNAMPAAWRNVITECPKKGYNADKVSTINDKVFLLSSYELFNNCDYSFYKSTIPGSEKQYEYFANGNFFPFYDYQTGSQVKIWTRTVSYAANSDTGELEIDGRTKGYVCYSSSNNVAFVNNCVASYSLGFVPCFTIS